MNPRTRDLARLGLTILALLALLGAIDGLASAALRRAPSWLAVGDPRQRILSSDPNQGATVVLIGDSVFYSRFIDREEQALWRQLEQRLGERVFPAALNGASPHDVLSIARRVARFWPAGTTALVGIHPLRIFGPGAAELRPDGPFAQRFRRMGDGDAPPGEGWRGRADEALAGAIERHSFLLQNRESILWYLESQLKRAKRRMVETQRDAVWTDPVDTGGLERLRDVEAMLSDGGAARQVPFSWISRMEQALRAAGIRPVFILTPLNVEMIRRYGRPNVPSEAILVRSHEYLVEQFQRAGFEFIDLFTAVDSASFADVAHTNARGNAQMATAIAGWLAARPASGR